MRPDSRAAAFENGEVQRRHAAHFRDKRRRIMRVTHWCVRQVGCEDEISRAPWSG